MNRTKRHVTGFTLVELLVVISIVGILVGLLLPAVNMVRESARRTSCSNNIRQIAIGLHNFETAKSNLPSGINSAVARVFPSASWLTAILPFMEENNMWEKAVSDYQSTTSPFSGHSGLKTVVSTFGCPSDPSSGESHWTTKDRFTILVASTDYVGVNGTNYQNRDGIFYLNSKTKFGEITDGLSNTLMAGERPPSPDFWYGWWYAGNGQDGSGSPDMVLGVREINVDAVKLEECERGPHVYKQGNNEMCDTLHFWSNHPGGAVFAMADGAVGFIAYAGNDLMPALSTRAGAETNDPPW